LKFEKKYYFKYDNGFTLIELVVVVAIMSIFAMISIPRIVRFINIERTGFAVLTGMMTKTFDDSFLNSRNNYLTIHLFNADSEKLEIKNEIFSRKNSISVLNHINDKWVDNNQTILKHIEFSDRFKIEKVLLSSEIEHTMGNVKIPYHPGGYAENAVIHILVNDEHRWSVRIYKHMKEPEVIKGYVNFE